MKMSHHKIIDFYNFKKFDFQRIIWSYLRSMWLWIPLIFSTNEDRYGVIWWKRFLNVYQWYIFFILITEPPLFYNCNITSGKEKITIRFSYGVPKGSPSVVEVKWTKNGEKLDLKNQKYFEGRLNDCYLTISSPNLEDKGTYLCTVTNAVGSVSHDVTLGTV